METQARTKQAGPSVLDDAQREASRDEQLADLVPAKGRVVRDDHPKTILATLIGEALSHRLHYTLGTVVFWNSEPVQVSRAEAEHLAQNAIYWRPGQDAETGDAIKLPHPKFDYVDMQTGKPVTFPLPAPRHMSRPDPGNKFDAAYVARAERRKKARGRIDQWRGVDL